MATYYLDWNHGSASNSNAGTSESLPWKDLGAVVTRTFSAGDIIYLKAGTYVESAERVIDTSNGSGSAGNPIVVAAYPEHEGLVTVTRTGTPTGVSNIVGVRWSCAYWHVRGLEFRRRTLVRGNHNEFSFNDFNGIDYPVMPEGSGATLRQGMDVDLGGANGVTIRRNIYRNWRTYGDIPNHCCLQIYADGGQEVVVEDNWFQGAPVAGNDKDSANGAVWQRNLIDGSWHGNNQDLQAVYDFRDNVMRSGGWFNFLTKTTGARVFNNYFATSTKLWTQISSTDRLFDLEIYNNIFIPGNSSNEVWQSQDMPYYTGLFAYFDNNVYGRSTPQYKFDGVSQPLSFMTARGYELDIATGVALSSVYDGGWALKSPYTTAGRNNGPVGPVDASGNSIVALILDTSRYGPTAFDPGAPSNSPPNASFAFDVTALEVDVDASGSSDIDGTIADPAGYSWNWGDGSAAGSGKVTSHTYAASGTYNVTLTVTDDDTATDQQTQQVQVESSPGGGFLQLAAKRVSPGRRIYVPR